MKYGERASPQVWESSVGQTARHRRALESRRMRWSRALFL